MCINLLENNADCPESRPRPFRSFPVPRQTYYIYETLQLILSLCTLLFYQLYGLNNGSKQMGFKTMCGRFKKNYKLHLNNNCFVVFVLNNGKTTEFANFSASCIAKCIALTFNLGLTLFKFKMYTRIFAKIIVKFYSNFEVFCHKCSQI